MAYLADIPSPGNVKDVRQVMDYLRQLEDQLRYVIQHIGAENIQQGAIGEEQLSHKVNEDMRAVRKTVKDMGRSLSSYRQTAEEIALEVRRLEEDGVEKVSNSALTINADGIDMSGGEINIRAGSAFRAKSGGLFEVFAADENSCLKFGGTEQNPNASLGNGGTLRVKTIYADSIHAGSSDYWSGGENVGGSQVVVSATQPQGHGLLWIKPLTANIADYALTPSAALSMDGEQPERTLALARTRASALEGQTCRYGVKFSIYNASAACTWTRVQVYLLRAGQTPLLIHESSPNTQVGVGDYFRVDTLAAPSAALENLTAAADLQMQVRITKSAGTQASFSVNSPILLRCFATENGAGDGTQPCDVRYIP
ncbi:MAG: hypothetical protein IKH57_22395 [Clostridia bacterium]|nr:hypothetical protein [Clostridia bacterium]